jgi:hypothetical protein
MIRVSMIETVPEQDSPQLPRRFEAYVRYRGVGGLILTVHERYPSGLAGTRLLVVLDQRAWAFASLEPGEMPAFTLSQHLVTYGYMRDRSMPLQGTLHGWRPVTGTVPGETGRAVGRPASLAQPRWMMPVVQIVDAEGVPDRCWCNATPPPRSFCTSCSPERQEEVYLYAITDQPGSRNHTP